MCLCFFFFKQKTAYEIYQCDWSSDVCSSDLALKDSDWNKSKAARLLHIDRTALYNRIKKYDISIPDKEQEAIGNR